MTPRFKVIFEEDPYPDMSWLDQWNTPATYQGNEVLIDGKPLSFDAYMRTYGNPDYHRMLAMRVYRLSPEDEDWQLIDSLGGIDFVMDATDDSEIGTFYHLNHIHNAYQRELAQEAGIV